MVRHTRRIEGGGGGMSGNPGLCDPQIQAHQQYRRRSEYQYPWLSLAKVIGRNTSSGTIDVLMGEGGPWYDIPIVGGFGGDSGDLYLPHFTPVAPFDTANGVVDLPIPGTHDLWAVVGYLGGNSKSAICLGFLRPLNSQLFTKTQGMAVSLHESGVYRLTTPTGATEVHWPDGSYMRVGDTATPHDMANENAAWAPATSGTKVEVNLMHSSGATVTISSVGQITVTPANGQTLVLGSAGSAADVARKGDAVQVTVSGTVYDGMITGGSSTVLAS